MKPILHIIKNTDDEKAIEIIRIQGMDNAYGVAAVFINTPSPLPSIPNVRICVLRTVLGTALNAVPEGSFELIDYDKLLNMIFSVETISVW